MKVHCDKCGFDVNPVDHELRCAPGGTKRGEWTVTRVSSWLGDAVHAVDIRLIADFLCIGFKDLQTFQERYTSNASMAAYMRTIDSALSEASDRHAAELFESSYDGDFRMSYVSSVFGSDVWTRVSSAYTPPDVKSYGAHRFE